MRVKVKTIGDIPIAREIHLTQRDIGRLKSYNIPTRRIFRRSDGTGVLAFGINPGTWFGNCKLQEVILDASAEGQIFS